MEIGLPTGAFGADQYETVMRRVYGVPLGAVLVVIAMALYTSACAAPEAPSPPGDPTLDEIIARHIDARGGIEKLSSIKSLKETGHVTAGARRGARVSRERKRPDRMRIEFTVQGVTGIQIFDGKEGWKFSPLDGDLEPQPLPDEAEVEAAEEADIDGPLVDWKAKGHQVEFVGREMLNDRDTYKLKITLASGAVFHQYLDAETFTRVRSDSSRMVRGKVVRTVGTYSDYRSTDGVLFPHLIEVEAVGRPQRLRVVVDTIEINPDLSDERFVWNEGDE